MDINKTDPRLILIGRRLSAIRRIISVSSGKGGVGKSVVSTALALALSKLGKSVGLLDLDFYGPTCLTILGSRDLSPIEEKGLIPPKTNNICIMSIEYFTKDNPLPIRGNEVTDAIIELLSITNWGKLDFLIIDMPPGLGDEILDILRLIPNAEHLLVTTPSKLSINVVKRLIDMLKELKSNILGLIINMSMGGEKIDLGVKILGKIRFDPKLEEALGDPEKILETDFGRDVYEIAKKILH